MDVVISNLVKTYGKFRALDDISLHMGSGMFGLLGPNGAGKTTLMRIITTLLTATSGQVTVDGYDVRYRPADVRRQLGYLPQEFGFYKSLNAYELLDYVGIIKGLERAERRRQIATLLEQVHLTHEAKRRIGQYSGGMKQRLGIAQALIGNPRLLVVDEPTAGLDPEERIRFRNLLAHFSGQRTVILSTHIVADIEVSCTQVAVLNHGRLAFTGTPGELAAQAQGCVWQLDITPDEYEALEQQYTIVSTRLANGSRQVHVLAAENPWGRGLLITPDLEEGYMSVIAHSTAPVGAAHA